MKGLIQCGLALPFWKLIHSVIQVRTSVLWIAEGMLMDGLCSVCSVTV